MEIFKEICAIPHGSGNIKGISDYLVSFAKRNYLKSYRDEIGNVIIYRPAFTARFRDVPPVILQAHMDMVAVSRDPYADMSVTPVKMIERDGVIRAESTSLGADNGLGCAYILSLLSDMDLDIPPIEAVFTIDEETGMGGASALDVSHLSGKYMINLDNECENHVIVSSAGGADVDVCFDIDSSCFKTRDGVRVSLSLFGLAGGHSGSEIDKKRANAILVVSGILNSLAQKYSMYFCSMEAGTAKNAIASSADVSFVIDKQEVFDFRQDLKEALKSCRNGFLPTDPGFDACVVYDEGSFVAAEDNVTKILFMYFSSLDNGVLEEAQDGSVMTSINWGLVRFDGSKLFLSALARSNDNDKLRKYLQDVMNRLSLVSNALKIKTEIGNIYSAWKENWCDELFGAIDAAYNNVCSGHMEKRSIHAGVECGVFAKKLAGVSIVSIGPTIFNVHSCDEHFVLERAEIFYDVIRNLLENWNLKS